MGVLEAESECALLKALPRKARLLLGKAKDGFPPREPSDLIHAVGTAGQRLAGGRAE